MKPLRRRRVRTFRHEQLESRHLMAGNIIATQIGADLIVTGDDFDNTVWLQQTSPNEVSLRGLSPGEPAAGTLVNGIDTSFEPVRFQSITGAIIVNLNGGNDRAFVFDGQYNGPVTLNLGAGNDFAEVGRFGSVVISSDVVVQLGDGDDAYVQGKAVINGSQRVECGPGNDAVTMSGAMLQGSFLIDGAAGFDAIRLNLITANGFGGILGGSEGDLIEARHTAFSNGASILAGAGGDLVTLDGCYFFSMLVSLAEDYGLLNMQGCVSQRETYITAAGPSDIRVVGTRAGLFGFGRLEILTGPLNDRVAVENCQLDQFYAMLGEGNDQLFVSATTVEQHGLLDGQGGRDFIFLRGNFFRQLGGANFESADIA